METLEMLKKREILEMLKILALLEKLAPRESINIKTITTPIPVKHNKYRKYYNYSCINVHLD